MQFVEFHQFADECVFFGEMNIVLCELDTLFDPSAVVCYLEYGAVYNIIVC